MVGLVPVDTGAQFRVNHLVVARAQNLRLL
jgi:hypothetical protein